MFVKIIDIIIQYIQTRVNYYAGILAERLKGQSVISEFQTRVCFMSGQGKFIIMKMKYIILGQLSVVSMQFIKVK